MDPSINRREAANILQWGGVSLILIYAVTIVFAAYPVALTRPEWLAQISGSLRGGASFALVGSLLLVVATQLDSGVHPLVERLGLIRRLCLLAAIGFVLLIPLQTYASVSLARGATGQERQALRSLNRAIQTLRNADSEERLRAAIRDLPGAPPLDDRRFNTRFEVVRDKLIEQLVPEARRVENLIGERNKARIMAGLQGWIRDGLISACYALGFAGLGKGDARSPSLLESLSRR